MDVLLQAQRLWLQTPMSNAQVLDPDHYKHICITVLFWAADLRGPQRGPVLSGLPGPRRGGQRRPQHPDEADHRSVARGAALPPNSPLLRYDPPHTEEVRGFTM